LNEFYGEVDLVYGLMMISIWFLLFESLLGPVNKKGYWALAILVEGKHQKLELVSYGYSPEGHKSTQL
jgi:hypothetical protein